MVVGVRGGKRDDVKSTDSHAVTWNDPLLGERTNDTGWTDLMSVEGAAEAAAAITDATQLELQSCITDIYLMGIEDGRVLEREVY